MKLMFCMFAEDVDLLSGELFTPRWWRTSTGGRRALARQMQSLFEAMATGGDFGADRIPHFNGGLFADASAIELTADEIAELVQVNECDWGDVEPSIFGTLFERTLDPDKRARSGAHYTGKEDILAVLEPVLMAPLRREWEAVRAECDALWQKIQENMQKAGPHAKRRKPSKEREEFDRRLLDFAHRLARGEGPRPGLRLRQLPLRGPEPAARPGEGGHRLRGRARDPASCHSCGPGSCSGSRSTPTPRSWPRWSSGSATCSGSGRTASRPKSNPVLEPRRDIRLMDAILDRTDPDEPEGAGVAGGGLHRRQPAVPGRQASSAGELGDEYVDALFEVYRRARAGGRPTCAATGSRRPGQQIEAGKCRRAGLLATQSIRGGANRDVLQQIKATGDIFFAGSDRDWVLDGATVHVSMVGFDGGEEADQDARRCARSPRSTPT